MEAISLDLPVHLLAELRYGVNCTLAAAHGRVATPWNRTTIPRRCALPAWMQVLSVSRSGSCALHRCKRTLHLIQLRILG